MILVMLDPEEVGCEGSGDDPDSFVLPDDGFFDESF